jgi:hypothetical protein
MTAVSSFIRVRMDAVLLYLLCDNSKISTFMMHLHVLQGLPRKKYFPWPELLDGLK